MVLVLTCELSRLCPIFQVSNVTGEGLDFVSSCLTFRPVLLLIPFDQVRTFLNLLPSSEADNEKFTADQPLEVTFANLVMYLI